MIGECGKVGFLNFEYEVWVVVELVGDDCYVVFIRLLV